MTNANITFALVNLVLKSSDVADKFVTYLADKLGAEEVVVQTAIDKFFEKNDFEVVKGKASSTKKPTSSSSSSVVKVDAKTLKAGIDNAAKKTKETRTKHYHNVTSGRPCKKTTKNRDYEFHDKLGVCGKQDCPKLAAALKVLGASSDAESESESDVESSEEETKKKVTKKPSKTIKKTLSKRNVKEESETEESDDESEEDTKTKKKVAPKKAAPAKGKGKSKATDAEEESDDEPKTKKKPVSKVASKTKKPSKTESEDESETEEDKSIKKKAAAAKGKKGKATDAEEESEDEEPIKKVASKTTKKAAKEEPKKEEKPIKKNEKKPEVKKPKTNLKFDAETANGLAYNEETCLVINSDGKVFAQVDGDNVVALDDEAIELGESKAVEFDVPKDFKKALEMEVEKAGKAKKGKGDEKKDDEEESDEVEF